MQVCSRCGDNKPIEDYYRNSSGNPYNWCKLCDKIRVQAWDRRNKDRLKSINLRKRQARPEQFRARQRVAYAIKTGKLAKPNVCEDCGANDRRIYGHHADYGKPLQVNWVCSKCHASRHKDDYLRRGK